MITYDRRGFGSGQRTHEAVEGARLALIEGGPHGLDATHPAEFNRALLDFLGQRPVNGCGRPGGRIRSHGVPPRP